MLEAERSDFSKKTGLSDTLLAEIRCLAQNYGVHKVLLFGSRARGDFLKTSDIDLATEGGDSVRFALDVDEYTSTLLKFDVVDLDEPVQEALKNSILEEGLVLYEEV